MQSAASALHNMTSYTSNPLNVRQYNFQYVLIVLWFDLGGDTEWKLSGWKKSSKMLKMQMKHNVLIKIPNIL